MIRNIVFTAILYWVVPANAEEIRLNGDQIAEILAGTSVAGVGFRQQFFAPKNNSWPAGTTYDEDGKLTFGKWEARGNRYCSQWPPNEFWACYQMYRKQHAEETTLIWIDSSGRRFVGKIVK